MPKLQLSPPSIGVAALVAWIALGSGALHAQHVNNDYYASGGTELLRNVELYHLKVGEDKMKARQYKSAFGDFRFILNYYPNHPKALLLMAQLCEAWKSPTCRTDAFFEDAITRNPQVAATFSTYGIYLVRTKKPGPAVEQFKRALAIDPDSMNAHYNIGLAYLDLREFTQANEHAQKAYALGAGVPGLRDRLQRAGYWKPLPATAASPAEPAATGSAPAAGTPPSR